MNRKIEVERQMETLRREQMDLEQEEFLKEAIPAAQKSVGDTFVYRNNSRGGGYDKFDTFYRVVAFTPRTKHNYGVTVILERIQIDDEGRASLELDSNTILPGVNRYGKSWNHVGLLSSCVPCPTDEYASMRNRVLAAFDNPADLLAALAKR